MAGNRKFHNKFHSANHHTLPSPHIIDSGLDPIASHEFPFIGDLVMNGTLSASNNLLINRGGRHSSKLDTIPHGLHPVTDLKLGGSWNILRDSTYIDGDTVITGNLSALGETSYFATQVYTTSATEIDIFSDNSNGKTAAFAVDQHGSNDLFDIRNDASSVLVITGSGDGMLTHPEFTDIPIGGHVGVNLGNLNDVSRPNQRMTIVGSVSVVPDPYETMSQNQQKDPGTTGSLYVEGGVHANDHSYLDQLTVDTTDGNFLISGGHNNSTSNILDVHVPAKFDMVTIDTDDGDFHIQGSNKVQIDTKNSDGISLDVKWHSRFDQVTVDTSLGEMYVSGTQGVDIDTHVDIDGHTKLDQLTVDTTDGTLYIHGGSNDANSNPVDIDVPTFLDKVTIDTTDGTMTVSGSNEIYINSVNTSGVGLDVDTHSLFDQITIDTTDGDAYITGSNRVYIDSNLAKNDTKPGFEVQSWSKLNKTTIDTTHGKMFVSGGNNDHTANPLIVTVPTELDKTTIDTDEGDLYIHGDNKVQIDTKNSDGISLDVKWHSRFDQVTVDTSLGEMHVTGTQGVDIDTHVDIDGHTKLDQLTVDTTDGTLSAHGTGKVSIDTTQGLDVDTHTQLDQLTVDTNDGKFLIKTTGVNNIFDVDVPTLLDKTTIDTTDGDMVVQGTNKVSIISQNMQSGIGLDVTTPTLLNKLTVHTTAGGMLVSGSNKVTIEAADSSDVGLDVDSKTLLDWTNINTNDGVFYIGGGNRMLLESLDADTGIGLEVRTHAYLNQVTINTSNHAFSISGDKGLNIAGDTSIGQKLSVDGLTELDQVTVNTNDGIFLIEGSNILNVKSESQFTQSKTTLRETVIDTRHNKDVTIKGSGVMDVDVSDVDFDGHVKLDRVTVDVDDGDFLVNSAASWDNSNKLDVRVPTTLASLTASTIQSKAVIHGEYPIIFNSPAFFNRSADFTHHDVEFLDIHVSRFTDLNELHVDTSNGDMVVSGTGGLKIHTPMTIDGDMHITGDLTVDGNAYLSAGIDGVINVGDTNTDSVVFYADVDSDVIPNVTNKYNLGTPSKRWTKTYAASGHYDRLNVSHHVDIEGTLDVNAHTNLDQLTVHTSDGDMVVSGQHQLHVSTTDGVDIDTDVDIDGHTQLDQVTIDTSDGKMHIIGEGGVDIDTNFDIDGHTQLDQVTVDTDDGEMHIMGEGGLDIDTHVDIDGHTQLDQVTVDTTDGRFLVSGGNNDTTAHIFDVHVPTELDMLTVDTSDGRLLVSGTGASGYENPVDIDVPTHLDRTHIDTTDGSFIVSGDNRMYVSAELGLWVDTHTQLDQLTVDTTDDDMLVIGTNKLRVNTNQGVDIDTHTQLDQVTIDTNDGDMIITGDNRTHIHTGLTTYSDISAVGGSWIFDCRQASESRPGSVNPSDQTDGSVDNWEYENVPTHPFVVKCNSLFESGISASGPVQIGPLPAGVVDELTEPTLEVFGNMWLRDGNLKIDSDIRHRDNERTLIRFSHDQISLVAGDARLLTLTEKLSTIGNDLVEIGDADQPADLKLYKQGDEISLFHDSTDGHVEFTGNVGIGGHNTAAPVIGDGLDVIGSARVTQTLSAHNLVVDYLTVQNSSFGNVGTGGYGSAILSPLSGIALASEVVSEWTDQGVSQDIHGTPVGIEFDLQYDDQGDIQKMYSFTFEALSADVGLGVKVGDTQSVTYRLVAKWDGDYTIAEVFDAEDGILYTSDEKFVTVSSVVLSATSIPTTERVVKVVAQADVDCNYWVHNVLSQDKPQELDTVTTADFRIGGNLTVDGDQLHDGDSTITGDLYVQGDVRVDGNAYLSAGPSGIINVGDQDTDVVNILADVDSYLLPDVRQRLNNNEFKLNSPGGSTTPSTISGWSVTDGALKAVALNTDVVTPNTPTVSTVSITQVHNFIGGVTYDVDVNVLYEQSPVIISLDQSVKWSDGTVGPQSIGEHARFTTLQTPPTSITVTLNQSTEISEISLYKSHDIGSPEKEWDQAFVKNISVSEQMDITGGVVMQSGLHIMGDLRVDGNAYLSGGTGGVINVGDANTDNVVFNADVDSDIIPDINITHDLGTASQQWRELFVQNIKATGDVTVSQNLDVELGTTLHDELIVSGMTTIGGNTVLSGTLDVDDATRINDTLDVEQVTTLHDNLTVSGMTTIGGNTVLSGTLDVDDATRINDTLDVEQVTTLHDNLTVSGHSTIGGNTTLSGTLDVDDATRINDTLDVELSTTLHSDLIVSGNTTLSGTLDVDDATRINDTLNVELSTTLHDNLTVSGHSTIGGNTTLSGTLDVDDATRINDTLDVELTTTLHSDLIVSGDATTKGNTTLSGMLDVDDATRINDTLDVELTTTLHEDLNVSGMTTIGGNTTLSGMLDVDDATRINDTLDVEQTTTLHSDLIVSGNTTLSGTLDVDDATRINDTLDVELTTTLHGDLNVSGHTTLSGELGVESKATFEEDVWIKGDLRVDGNAYLSAGTSGTINIGDSNTDNIIFYADVDSSIYPNVDNRFDIGSSTRQWQTLFVHDIISTGSVFVTGDITVGGGTILSGTLDVDDATTLHDELIVSGHGTIGGNTVLSGTLDVDDATTLHDELIVSGHGTIGGNTTLSGMLDVDDATTLHDELIVSGHGTIGGNTTLSGTLDVDDATTLHDELIVSGHGTIGGNTTLSGMLDVDGATNVHDTLDVELSTTLHDELIVSGHGTIGGNTVLSGALDVDDATRINDTLDVEQVTTLHDELIVSGMTTIGGHTVLSGTLDVDDATHVHGSLDVTANSTFHNDVLVLGNLRVNGNAYLSGGSSGDINIGDSSDDNVMFHADVDSNIIPNVDITYDIGSTSQQWRELYVEDIKATGDVYWSGGGSLSSNSVYNYVNTTSGTHGWSHLKPESGFGPTKLVLDPDEVPRLAITNVYTVSNPENVVTQQSNISRGDFVLVVASQDNLIATRDNPSGTYNIDTGNYTGYARLFAPENMVRVINGMQGQSVTIDPDDLEDAETDHKFVEQTEKENWNNTHVSVSSLSARWSAPEKGTTNTLSRTLANVNDEKRFLTMQSNNPAKDSDWNNVDWEHTYITPYSARIIKIMLRGRNTAGKTIKVGIHSNTGKSGSDGKEYECFTQTAIEERDVTFTHDLSSMPFEFTDTSSINEGDTLGVSVSATGDIGPCNVTIFMEYPNYIFTEDARKDATKY